jgi:hypothetical protein
MCIYPQSAIWNLLGEIKEQLCSTHLSLSDQLRVQSDDLAVLNLWLTGNGYSAFMPQRLPKSVLIKILRIRNDRADKLAVRLLAVDPDANRAILVMSCWQGKLLSPTDYFQIEDTKWI